MALQTEEADVVGPGIQANAPTKGAFALNMLYKNNCWQVRKGFGQVSQFDTTLSLPTGGSGFDWGYGKQLGSRLIKTAFGNLQMVTIFLATCNTSVSNASDSSSFSTGRTASTGLDVYIVHIYDLTTDERFEVPLYGHTSQKAYPDTFIEFSPGGTSSSGRTVNASSSSFFADAPTVQGQYQTHFGQSYQSWIKANDEFFYFEEFEGVLYFGNRFTGTWAYRPTSFSSIRPIGVDVINTRESMGPYSESSIVVPVVFVPGESVASFEYFRTGDIPRPVDVANVLGRFYYAAGREIFISDQASPNHIIGLNFFQVPCREDIVAVAAQNGNLLIFTPNETWLYQPSTGPVASDGKLTQISAEIGCIGPNAIVDVESSVVFVDTSGVYASTGNLSIQSISDDIEPFFTDTMPNPMTSFFLTKGQPSTASDFVRTTLRASFGGVKCSYSQDLGCLMICFPELDGVLCQSAGRWSWWSFESLSTSDGKPGKTANLPSPWVMAHQDQLFLIAGPDSEVLTDDSGSSDKGGDTKSRSFFICEYGRGGGVDRSVSDEDVRRFTGRIRAEQADATRLQNGYFFFDDPIELPSGYNVITPVNPTDSDATPVTLSSETYEVPISLVLTSQAATTGGSGTVWQSLRSTNHGSGATVPGNWIDKFTLRFLFDATRYTPVFASGSTTVLTYALASERIGLSVSNFGVTRTDASGVGDASGSYINIAYVGNSSTVPGSYYDMSLNVPLGRLSPLLSIYMKKNASTTDESTMGITPTVASVESTASSIDSNLASFVFDRWSPSTATVRQQDSVAQPVDWAYRSGSLGVNQGGELKFRGVYANLLSHGRADLTVTNANWQYGLFNVLAESDRRGLAAQVIDFTSDPAQVKQQADYSGTPPAASAAFAGIDTIRTTFQDSGGDMIGKTFAQSGGPTYSTLASDSTIRGDLLIGDEEVSDIAVSLGVKGQSFSVMMFGFIRNKAERLFIEGAKAAFRVVGGRRRKGR
jgi:hypothetical protein